MRPGLLLSIVCLALSGCGGGDRAARSAPAGAKSYRGGPCDARTRAEMQRLMARRGQLPPGSNFGCSMIELPGTPDEVARRWIDAMNDHAWDAACALSVPVPGISCTDVLADAFGVERLSMELEGVYTAGGDRATVAISGDRGPLTAIELERRGDAWLVHFEFQSIR